MTVMTQVDARIALASPGVIVASAQVIANLCIEA